ncbi:MAG: type II secretion system protein [Candidatus Omnitrophota bacterium]|nr:type II secretion system GspH family protein [Candidatus Omnitrophota bacterium]
MGKKISRALGYFLSKYGFTLTEILVVVLIIGVLAALALPRFDVTRENSFDKEAKVNLKLIQAAEKIYRVKFPPAYYPSASGTVSSIANINQFLMLSLPTTNPNWKYSVRTQAGTPPQTSYANRTTNSRCWRLNINDDEPVNAGAGACP